MIIFETSRLYVRKYREEDFNNFYLLNSDETVMRYIRPVKTMEECSTFFKIIIDHAEKNPGYGRFAAHEKETDEFVGSFAVIPIEKTEKIQIGYALLPKFWGKGYATELTKTGVEYVFNNLELQIVYAITETANIASQNVLIKCGFGNRVLVKENEKDIFHFSLTKENYHSIKP